MKKYIQHQAPILPVRDLGKTLQFYRVQLGFEIAWVWEDGYGSVINREIEIHFSKSENVTPQSLYFFVNDADKVHAFLKKQGVKIIDSIESKPWGMREFAFEDINGHILRVGHGEKGTDEIDSFKKNQV